MLQFGGHHLAINLTMAGSQASMTPSLPAAQPATFTWEGRTVRPLGDEHDKGFALINALDDKQKAQAILSYRVADLVLGATQDGKTIQPEGIRASALTAAQQTMLWDLVREWSGISADAYAEARMTELKSHLNDTYFAWSGPTTNSSVAYYRIQGPTLVIDAPATDARVVGWAAFKHDVDLYFFWHGVHWQHNRQNQGERKQDVWAEPITFDNRGQPRKPVEDQGYINGDGVLFYPGQEVLHAQQDRGIPGPIGSVQLANLRRECRRPTVDDE